LASFKVNLILNPKVKKLAQEHYEGGLKYGLCSDISVHPLSGDEIAYAIKILLKDYIKRKQSSLKSKIKKGENIMKIIEALKKIKDLKRKSDDLRVLIRDHSAISSVETPKYPDQKRQVELWMQSHNDILKEISRLKIGLAKTNLNTNVKIQFGDKTVEKTILEWIIRRRELVPEELLAYKIQTDRNIKEGQMKIQSGDMVDIKIQRFYDPKLREEKIMELTSEPYTIDGHLEIVNAITDLIE
jgi:hypothetical protein